MRHGQLILSLGLLLALVTLPGAASAAVVFFEFGETIYESGPLPEHYQSRSVLEGARSGYKCDVFSVFWANVHRWSCEAVVFRGTTVIRREDRQLDREMRKAVEKAYPGGPPELEGWAAHGRWAILGVIVLFFLMPMFRKTPF